ncbi:hypothetical protein [Streptomyces sp. CB01201]|nr:hypothetical protein [Streptomyces sp. CB01201]
MSWTTIAGLTWTLFLFGVLIGLYLGWAYRLMVAICRFALRLLRK